MSAISVAICICTRNRPDQLRTALQSIEQSSLAPAEILISDDSTDDATRTMLRREFPHLRYLEGPRRGVAANRNNVLKFVSTEHVMFFDDDGELDKDYLSTIVARIAQCPSRERATVIVSGLELNGQHVTEPRDISFLGYQSVPYKRDYGLRTYVCAGTVLPTELFSTLGFDENIVYGYEDVDLPIRAAALGYQVILCRTACNKQIRTQLNRDYYSSFVDASRLYVTLKRYVFVERSYLNAFAFVLIAPLHLMVNRARKRGLVGIVSALRTLRLSLLFFYRYLTKRPRTDAPPRRPQVGSPA